MTNSEHEAMRKVLQGFLEYINEQGLSICDGGQDMEGDYFYSPIFNVDELIEGFLKEIGK